MDRGYDHTVRRTIGAVSQLAVIRAVSAEIRGDVVVVHASGRPGLAGVRIPERGLNDSGTACAHDHAGVPNYCITADGPRMDRG